jgi:transcription antitermination factor NusG
MTGGPETKVGARVRITSGLYAGELATVESVAGGVIPAVVVRTDTGRSRRARTVDLEPVTSAEEPTN